MAAPHAARHPAPMSEGRAVSRDTSTPTGWTYSEYARLPDDGNKYEVIDGEVFVTPAPTPNHQRVATTLFFELRHYVERYGLGEMLWDVDLLFVSGQFLRPDMLFVPTSERDRVTDRGMEGVPGLVVEVLSPSTASVDRVRKPRRYADFGVPAYWVVDPWDRMVLEYELSRGQVDGVPYPDRVEWRPDPAAPALELDVPPLFRSI